MVKFTSRGDANLLLPGIAASPSSNGPLFANLGFGMLGATPSPALSIKEPRTGTDFSGEFCYHKGQRNCPRITGAGARTKKIAGIKSIDIYSLGLYVEEGAARSALHHYYSNSTPEEIANDPALFTRLQTAGNIEKSLVLCITSGVVKRKNFLDALNERLAPPMTQAKEGAALEAFKQQFDEVTFTKGLEISFTFTGGKLVTKADGKELKTLTNNCLAQTLLDIYIGSNPVSPGAKKAFATGLARMLVS